ncbi:DUF4145 domain-containing protein [Marinomonas sp. FW-1]|uniref:DUF4145 domain-containing protein n=1 Tax=Marinomonas sp. FW-1 TaxID=2071621 RepID=UPI0010BF987F|nr:DUF4145 domain-containing protein [Marinomonas sp. FW-1]
MADWYQSRDVESRSYQCGFCGHGVASARGYLDQRSRQRIRICPHCEKPTFFDTGIQVPQVAPGNEVKHLPESVEQLYKEARSCVSIQAYTSSVLSCRKLLMNIAVSQGAEEGKNFFHYVEYLANNGFVPPNGRGWVDHIRKRGNEATHEIVVMTKEMAEELISFVEMLLKFIYEFPAQIPTD